MLRRFQTDPEKLSPEDRERTDAAIQHLGKLHERGVYSPGKPGDDFAIGLDDNYNPFPVTKPVTEHNDSDEV